MSMPSTMQAVLAPEQAGADHLEISQIDVPACGQGKILIKVAAAGVNRPDILQRDGLYPAPKGHSLVLGLEVAGEIVGVGPDVTAFQIGDKVTALVNGGGYAQYCLADQGAALPIPDGLSMIEAAGLPETVFTVWHNVFQRGQLKPGEWFMVHGGSSGIGTTAIQMVKAIGAKVIATAGSEEKCEACRALGADEAINYKTQDFVESAKAATQGRGVDVILDMVGGEYIERNIAACAMEGRIVQIAFLGGPKAKVNFMHLMLKRLTLTGSTLRARSDKMKSELAQEVKDHVWPLISKGEIVPQIYKVFKFQEVIQAHKCMDQGDHIGKIMLDFS